MSIDNHLLRLSNEIRIVSYDQSILWPKCVTYLMCHANSSNSGLTFVLRNCPKQFVGHTSIIPDVSDIAGLFAKNMDCLTTICDGSSLLGGDLFRSALRHIQIFVTT